MNTKWATSVTIKIGNDIVGTGITNIEPRKKRSKLRKQAIHNLATSYQSGLLRNANKSHSAIVQHIYFMLRNIRKWG